MNETAARHPNRFLADLTQAMRSTAETARQATIDQCQADAKAYTEQLHARTDDEAASLRKAAEADVSSIRDWSKAEMERLRVETEQRIARRRELLEQELQEYNAAIELEVERVQKHVSSFEEEVANFFEQLLQEADPTVFASMAVQMPDPPSFTELDRGRIATNLRERREEIMRPAESPVGGNGTQPAPAPVESAAAVKQAKEPTAEATAAPTLEAAPEPAPEAAPEAAPAAPSKPASSIESTRVVVVGLVSVASIATFKRQLGRMPGVKNVGVSSGPDGEFVFTVGHGAETSLSTLIPALPAFQARVVNERQGLLNVSAHDPEAEG